jgi:hypothetical protein
MGAAASKQCKWLTHSKGKPRGIHEHYHQNRIKSSLLGFVSRKGYCSLLDISLHHKIIFCCQASGAWLLYKSNTQESFLYATLKGFSVFDDREGTKDELRLAIGKSATVWDTSSADGYDNPIELDSGERRIQKDLGLEPIPSMLILDAIFRKSSLSVSLCVQRPKFLVALDFLVATVEFFVPSAQSFIQ